MKALIRIPSPRLAEGIVTHIDRTPVDVDLAVRQHEAYAAALRDCGWETVEVDPAPDCPDSVFIEDALVVRGQTALVTRPAAPSRHAETAGAEAAAHALGLDVTHIEAPGTLDGGDVLQVGDTVYVGRGGRTNAEGVRQLRAAGCEGGARRVTGRPAPQVGDDRAAGRDTFNFQRSTSRALPRSAPDA